MAYWLMKSEPGNYSIDDLLRDKSTDWTGVRNHQAKNFMAKDMKPKDFAIFYHSNAEPSAAVGVMEILGIAKPDRTQFDAKSQYFEPKATRDKPVWFCVDVGRARKFKSPVSIAAMRETSQLRGLEMLKRGSRLSITPLSAKEFETLCQLGGL